MFAYIIFVFICEVAAIQSEDINVGTVLFSSSDIKKKRWTRTEVGLLRARRHFQEVIISPKMINMNDNFINSLLDYFKNTYSSVKSEAKDSKEDSIMNAALSDVIGGYLKSWVLPITKFAYYGGTVSQESARKLFKLYDEIKRSLDTNGRTWRTPNTDLLNSVAINVVPLMLTKPREADDPCDTFAYFVKTDTGLAVPVPDINWNENSPSMFVPLKNQSLIPLNSLNNESLIKYYNAATNCIGDSKSNEKDLFDTRFQNWLSRDVIPHLNDEQFYPALGSVLALVNRTRSLVDTVMDMYAESSTPVKKTTIAGIPLDFSSKKNMVITMIIVLEVAWCIPTLCYMLYLKLKRKRSDRLYKDEEKGKTNKKHTCLSISTQLTPTETRSEEVMCKKSETYYKTSQNIEINKREKLTLVQPSKSTNIEHSAPVSKFHIVKRSHTNPQKSHHNMRTKTAYEVPVCIKNHVKKTACEVEPRKSSTSREEFSCIYERRSSMHATNSSKNQDLPLGTTKTVTILDDQFKHLEISQNDNTITEDQNTITLSDVTESTKETCLTKKVTSKEVAKPLESTISDKSLKADSKGVPPKTQKILNDSKNREGLRLTSGNPFLEITIDRPQRQIFVDFGETPTRVKHSKIPKPALISSESQTHLITKTIQVPLNSKRRSLIPQRKKLTSDDVIIKSDTTKNDINLNLTL